MRQARRILFVLKLVVPGRSSAGVGLRMRHDVLAATPRLARGWRMEEDMETSLGRTGIGGPNRLVNIRDRQLLSASGFWGAKTGPNPTDRGKNGSKRHLIVAGARYASGHCPHWRKLPGQAWRWPFLWWMKFRQSNSLAAHPVSGLTNCSPIEPTTRKPAESASRCGSEASGRWSPTATPSMAAAWANTATLLKPASTGSSTGGSSAGALRETTGYSRCVPLPWLCHDLLESRHGVLLEPLSINTRSSRA